MKTREFNPEVLFADEAVRVFSLDDVEELGKKALASPAGKLRICLHSSPDAELHEMLVALRRDVRYPPHKNLKSEETHFVLLGEAALCLYSDDGSALNRIALGGGDSVRLASYSRIPVGVYHRLEIESDVCVFLETKLGPFDPADNQVAPFTGE